MAPLNYDERNFIESNGIIEINHPPYSLDLALIDYWLFEYIKQRLGDERLSRKVTYEINNKNSRRDSA